MIPVAVVTDSTADLGDLAGDNGITVVPLTVAFGNEQFHDGVDLSREEFYRRLGGDKAVPTTAQPPPSAFVATYRRLLSAGAPGIVSLHLSSALSGTYNSALAAAAEVDPEKIAVVDTRSVSLGLGLLALQAAEDARMGRSLEQIVARAVADSKKIQLYATIPNLTCLARGGRIGQLQGILGNVLKIVPIITLRDGEVAEHSKVRTFSRAVDQLVDIVTTSVSGKGTARVAILHSVAPELADSVASRIEAAVSPVLLVKNCVGSTVGTHAGPGAVGVVFIQ